MAHRMRRLGAVVTAAAVALAGLGVTVLIAAERFLFAPLDSDGMYVLAIIGSDTGPPRGGSPLDGNGDALHLMIIPEDRQHVTFLNYARDYWVDGRKLNSALSAGPDNMAAALGSLTGVEVDDWILTDFHGFVIAIDELGGLEISVEERLFDPSGSSSDLYPGPQRLRGLDALAYARDRHSRSDGDLGRSRAQTTVLQAIHDQVRKEAPSLQRISELVAILRRTTVSTISPTRLMRLVMLGLSLPPEAIENVTLPGTVGTAGDASVVFVTDSARAIMADVAADGYVGEPPTASEPPATEPAPSESATGGG